MIRKIVAKHRVDSLSEVRQNFLYWSQKSPQERLSAVDFLRSQVYGNTERLQRAARVIQRPQG
jgi:flavorubredoxin